MNRMLTMVVLMTVASVTLADTSAGSGVKPVTSFGYLDINKDARISVGEAKVDWAVAQQFAQADSNRDGFLDRDEFQTLVR
ncbi:MAG TPA: hypothetical protein VEZ88_10520 [Steroidobacteraceae bacterium]|nr:hypothetical protein [Steroidobacteraceae bacterium]